MEVKEMSWLDDVAEGIKTEKENSESYAEKIRSIRAECPVKIKEVWNMFTKLLDELNSKKEGLVQYTIYQDLLKFEFSGFKFEAQAEQVELMGGFYARIQFSCHQQSTKLPINEILLRLEDNDELKWVFKEELKETFRGVKFTPFTSEEVELILKAVFKRYL